MRARAKTDGTQPGIVRDLRAAGYLVQIIATVGGGVPDLLVGCPWGELVLVECKDPGGKGVKLTPAQAEWHQRWHRVPLLVATTAAEVIRWTHARRAASCA